MCFRKYVLLLFFGEKRNHSDAVLCLLNWLLIDDVDAYRILQPIPEASVSKFSFSTYFLLLVSVLALTSFEVGRNENK